MAVDLSFFGYFAPIIAFLIVFTVSFAVLLKIKIFGEHRAGLLFISFLIATLFVSFAGTLTFVQTVVPWFAVLLLSFAFILVLVGFAGNVPKGFHTGLSVFFIVALLLVFLVSGIVVFSDSVPVYLLDIVGSSRVVGAVVLLIVAGIASAVLLKATTK